MSSTTLARLRAALADDFQSFDAVARRLREAGMLPAGSGGRDGVGSAVLGPDQAAMLFLALISNEDPVDAPAAAQAMAAYALVGYFLPLIGPAHRYDPPLDAAPCTLLDFVSGEIEHAIDPAARVVGLWVEGNRVSTIDPDQLAAFERRPGDPPVLCDVAEARERLVFQPAADRKRPTSDDQGRPYIAGLSFVVRPALIGAVASAFRMQRRPATTLLSGGAA